LSKAAKETHDDGARQELVTADHITVIRFISISPDLFLLALLLKLVQDLLLVLIFLVDLFNEEQGFLIIVVAEVEHD